MTREEFMKSLLKVYDAHSSEVMSLRSDVGVRDAEISRLTEALSETTRQKNEACDKVAEWLVAVERADASREASLDRAMTAEHNLKTERLLRIAAENERDQLRNELYISSGWVPANCRSQILREFLVAHIARRTK
jgi:hypothetical protein